MHSSCVPAISGPILERAKTQSTTLSVAPSAIMLLPILVSPAVRSEITQLSKLNWELLGRMAGAVPVWPSPGARPALVMNVCRYRDGCALS